MQINSLNSFNWEIKYCYYNASAALTEKENSQQKKNLLTYGKFFTDDMITTILSNINKKFIKLIEHLPKEVCTNYKYT